MRRHEGPLLTYSVPLPLTHPELVVLSYHGFREYRVENWHLARDGSGRIINGVSHRLVMEVLCLYIISVFREEVMQANLSLTAFIVLVALTIWSHCSQVLSESVIVLPPHGIQLETHKGIGNLRLSSIRRFIPTDDLHDVVINEGLRRWNVHFYLAALMGNPSHEYSLRVAYENILPHFPVLLEVYRGVHDLLFDHAPESEDSS
ncbi:hypothetical protein FISHEDRAFT_37811 [Fistulina hepatica ATCC 64428]|nr:hypothetical protein FISHEDRAFT_37811 [Fistulina hepatica ATCC 64428]